MLNAVTHLFNAVLRAGHWPSRWAIGAVAPIPKPGGDPTAAGDYRGISLLPVLSKLLESVLNARLTEWYERTHALNDAQHGFRPSRSTIDAAFVLHEMVATTKEAATASRRPARGRINNPALHAAHHTMWIAYLDVRKAYDGCWRAGIIAQLRAHGIAPRTCQLFESMLAPGKVRRTVAVNGVRSDEFEADNGVPQGAVLSPMLYNTFIDGLARAIEADPRLLGATVHGIRIPSLLYADDIALTANSAQQLQQMLDLCAQYAARWHFGFNAPKCKVQIVGRDAKAEKTRTRAQPFTIADAAGTRRALDTIDTFKYLGLEPDFASQPTHSARWSGSMAARVASAYPAYHDIRATARRLTSLPPATEMQLFVTYCAPKAQYGAQLWAPFITTSQRDALDRIQNAFQAHALLPSSTAATIAPYCFTAGEFGRVPLSMHGDELALRYVHHCARAPAHTVLRRLFDARMAAAQQRAVHETARAAAIAVATAAAAAAREVPKSPPSRPPPPYDSGRESWCWALRTLCRRYGLIEPWNDTTRLPADRSEWVTACRTAVRTQWAKEWRQQTAQHERLSGLYSADRAPRPQPYLYVSCANRIGREVFVQTRSRTLPLGDLRAALLADARAAARSRTSGAVATARARSRACTHAGGSADDGAAGPDTATDALNVSDAHIARAALCDVCIAHGQHHTDTRQHFVAECDPLRFQQFVQITAAQLHRAVHAVRPEHAARCGAARDTVACVGPHECAGSVVEQNFRSACAADVINACLNGYEPWIIAGADLRKDEIYRPMVQAIIRCVQNFLLIRWNERTRKLGFRPVVAFAPKNFSRQVMQLTSDQKFIFALPTLPAPAAYSLTTASAVPVLAAGSVSAVSATPAPGAPAASAAAALEAPMLSSMSRP
jgi:hypothetical protein